ncbi:MAG: hypothetical protein H0T73_13580 [Ardenticatenales bacterium]|nr:hypothetical protein [Ardenticatenales bacterium]
MSNLTIACVPCNQRKGVQDVRDFLAHDPVRLARILAQAKAPLKDAAAVNSTRWALYAALQAMGLPVEVGTGGRTKWNRTLRGLPKTHWLDAACVGASTPATLWTSGTLHPLPIRATGHGSRQMCLMDKYGFPRTRAKQAKRVQGFQTGDIVRAVVPTGKPTVGALGEAGRLSGARGRPYDRQLQYPHSHHARARHQLSLLSPPASCRWLHLL